jgi:hypothetical protein
MIRLEAHGGYLCRLGDIAVSQLVELARAALTEDGQDPSNCSLMISVIPGSRVMRLAYDAPHTYGRRGAHWYDEHQALARRLSGELDLTVHAYVLDPDELEQVVTYGAGHRVGGECVRYEDAELPDDEGGLEEADFHELAARWPLGHLSKVLGIDRQELVRMPRAPTVLLNLDGSEPEGRLFDRFDWKVSAA